MPQIMTENLVIIITKMTETKAKYKLYERFASDAELAIPDESTFYTNTAKGYTDYPPMAIQQETAA